MEKTEKELVKAAQKNPEVFGALFDKYYEQIYKYTLKRTAHIQAAQDITSEVFFKAYKALWRFKWQGRPFSAWLYKIATNEINRYFKNGKIAPRPAAFMEELENFSVKAVSPETEFIEQQEEAGLRQDLTRLYQTVQNLPIKYQEVLALRFYEEKSILEICEILGKKEGTVKSLIFRGIGLLEKSMQPKDKDGVVLVERIINTRSHEEAGD